MSPEFRDTLEQSQKLLDERERAWIVYEARLQASKRALARADGQLTRLKELLARAGAPLHPQR